MVRLVASKLGSDSRLAYARLAHFEPPACNRADSMVVFLFLVLSVPRNVFLFLVLIR